jgi:diadenosine tetraphosphate (Ap4A) HIT family hydrolase
MPLRVLNDCFLCGDAVREPTASGLARFIGRDALDQGLIWEDEDLFLIPALGCITPGYTILAPKAHTISFSRTAPEVARKAMMIWQRIHTAGSSAKSAEYLAFEHGSGDAETPSPSCIEHAHLHFMPSPDHAEARAAAAGAFDEFRHTHFLSLLAMPKTLPYLWLATSEGYFSYPSAGGTSQFFRRVLARQWGIPHAWNWREHILPENFWQTKRYLDPLFQGWEPS